MISTRDNELNGQAFLLIWAAAHKNRTEYVKL